MSCPLTLNTLLTGHSTNGYFVYLGKSNTSQIAVNSPNGFGILSPLDNGVNGDIAGDGIVLNNPYTINSPISVNRFSILSYNTIINFSGASTGYYGFMYIAGDTANTGDVSNIIASCGDIEGFEVEVLQALPDYNNITYNVCLGDISTTIDLLTLFLTNNTNPSNATILFSGNNPDLGNLSGNILTVNSNPVIGTYVFDVTITLNQVTHPIISGCCTVEINTITINLLADVSSGTSLTIQACN